MQNNASKQDEPNKALFKAISKNDKESVKSLIAQGADINSTQNDLNYALCTCLYKALEKGYDEIAEILIKAGADLNLPSYIYADKTFPSYPILAAICAERNKLAAVKLVTKYSTDLASNDGNFALVQLCGSRNNDDFKTQFKCCKEILKTNIDFNYTSSLETTALFAASVSGNLAVAKLLIEYGAEKNLAYCFASDDYAPIELLRKEKSRLVNNEAFVLHHAVVYNNICLLEKMVKYGIDLNTSTVGYCNLTFSALDAAHDPTTREWLSKNGVTPKFSDFDQLKLLLNAEANQNERWNDHIKAPALHTAVSNSLPFEKAKILLKAGADVNTVDLLQQSAMHYIVSQKAYKNIRSLYASSQEILDTINLLIEKGASAVAKDKIGNTPLHLAAINGYGSVILEKLIEIGNDINDKNFYGETPLTLAAANNQKVTVKYLLSQRAKLDLTASVCFNKLSFILKELENIDSIDIKNSEYNTLLHYAAKRGLLTVVKKLMEKGIKINAFNIYHQTALDLAIKNDCKDIVEYLQIKGGKSYKNLSTQASEDLHCGYWIPKSEGEHSISYSLQGVSKEIYSKYNWFKFYGSSKVTRAQRKLILKVFEYVSSVFKIKFFEIGNSTDADLIIGQSFDESEPNQHEVKLQKENTWIISKASIMIDKYDLNDSKIKYYPNYSFAKILRYLGQILGLSLPKYHGALSNISIMDDLEEGIPDKDYKIQFLENDLIMLSSRYNFTKNHLEQVEKPKLQNIRNMDKEIALNNAIKENDINQVKQLIKEGADLNIPIKLKVKNPFYPLSEAMDLVYPLSEAIFNNNEQIVQILIESGAKVNIVRNDANTILKDACLVGSINIVNILLKAGADPNLYGSTDSGMIGIPLYDTIHKKHIDICKALLDAGANTKISLALYKNKNITSMAAYYGNVDIVKLFYKKNMKIDLATAFMLDIPEKISSLIKRQHNSKMILEALLTDAIDKNNFTLVNALVNYGVAVSIDKLHTAVIENKIDLVQALVPRITNINQYMSQETVLHVAARYKNEEMLSILLENASDPNLMDKDGYNALHLIMFNNNYINVSTIIKYGVNVNAIDQNGNTALHLAAATQFFSKYAETIMLLGADVNVRNTKNKTVLHLAIEHNCEGWIVELFKNFGGDLNPQLSNSNYYSYIDFALSCSNYKIIPNLLIHGVKYSLISAIKLDLRSKVHKMLSQDVGLNITDTDGNTPLHLAASKKYLDIAAELISKGAKLNILNKKNQTALDMAKEAKTNAYDQNKPMITYLISSGALTAVEFKHLEQLSKPSQKIKTTSSNVIDFKTKRTLH